MDLTVLAGFGDEPPIIAALLEELVPRRNGGYDPASGRFTQEDPIGLAGGMKTSSLDTAEQRAT